MNRDLASGRRVWRDTTTGDFRIEDRGNTEGQEVKRPRIALYKSYVPSMDEGWTRWLLEDFGFAYTSAFNRDLQNDNLRERFDVIVLPEQRADTIHEGFKAGTMPSEYTGGLGEAGAEALRRFAAKGGTIICLNEASAYALKYLGVEVKDALAGVSSREFYAPGSLLNVHLEQHPLTLGLPRDIALWFENGPGFEVTSRERAIAVYPEGHILASGWLMGEKYISRRAAIVDAPLGSGHVILFGVRPQYRAQSYQAFKLFFNALLYF